jgi:retron-type reverse transcriptase
LKVNFSLSEVWAINNLNLRTLIEYVYKADITEKGHSCINWFYGEINWYTLVVFKVDVKKVIDTVNHDHLLEKLLLYMESQGVHFNCS